MEAPEDGTSIAYSHCRDQWIRAFNEGPHTSFKMFQKILEVLELGAQDILHDLTRLSAFRARHVYDDQGRLYSTYNETWAGKSGRCTSFAIKVAQRLEQSYPGDGFQFEFFDLGKHRVARCQRYGFIIDSESRRGIEMLPDGVDWVSTPDRERGRWIYYNNHSVFEDTRDTRETRDVHPITAAAALGVCLEQVAKNAVLVCLFRSIPSYPSTSVHDQASSVQYRGVVRWRLASRRMELIPSLDNKDDFSTITFGDGDQATNRECAMNLVAFIKRCGIEDQWKADGIDRFNRQLWQAAILEWGYPLWRS